jgi:ribose-phosphate pyrophosphokinase
MLFTGNANPELAKQISDYLNIPLGDITVNAFNDGEVNV